MDNEFDYQGKSKKQVEDSTMIGGIALLMIISLVLGYFTMSLIMTYFFK